MKLPLSLAIAATVVSLSPCASALDVKVKSIERVATEAPADASYHPVFTADGNGLLVTSEAYDGLGLISLKDGSYKNLSARAGAGYKFAQSADGTQIVLRENDYESQKMALYTLQVATAAEQCIAPVVEHTNSLKYVDGVVAYAEPVRHAVQTWSDPRMASPMAVKTVETAPLLTEEDLKLVLYRNGTRTIVDPILETTGQDVNYCWSSISPDGKRMLFVAHNLAYTSDLDGKNLVCLGMLHAPVWRGDNQVVGMVDSDDGYFFTASEIFIADARTAETVQLTPDTDDIKMFPAVSPDGSRIAYATTTGELFIINLE